MKKSISKKIVFILILAMLFTMMPEFMQSTFADSGNPAMVIGSEVLATNVSEEGLPLLWFGRYYSPAGRRLEALGIT